MQNVRERCRRGQFERVTEHKRATTHTNKHSQIDIIRLMSVHQRNLLVRARSIWTDFLCLSVNSSRANANSCLDISNLVKMEDGIFE
jgi:hypothetical protein